MKDRFAFFLCAVISCGVASLNASPVEGNTDLDLRAGDAVITCAMNKGTCSSSETTTILRIDPVSGRITYRIVDKDQNGKVTYKDKFTVDRDFFMNTQDIEDTMNGCKTQLKKVTTSLGTFDVCEVWEYLGLPGRMSRIVGYARVLFGTLYSDYPASGDNPGYHREAVKITRKQTFGPR